MKLVPALEYEKQRQTTEDYAVILLNKDGKFYHAYNISAFILKNYVCTEEFQRQRGDKQPLQAKRYTTKGSDYVMLGFPTESLSKYVPEYKDVQSTAEGDDLLVLIDVKKLGDVTADTLQAAYEDWKDTCPVQESRKSKQEIAGGVTQRSGMGRSGLFAIVQEIIAYPIERKTPADNVEFISELKRKLTALL